ncbi:MAG: hypothetical protein AABY64_06080 [Bdellovibrionota bacterium]
MLREAQLIFKVFSLFLMASALSACATLEPQANKTKVSRQTTPQRVYYANFDQVWRAAHTVIRYTIANENQETGYLETEYVKAVDGWLPPDSEKKPSAGLRYKLIVSFSKGKVDSRDSTRVTIEKRIEVLRDFFSEPETVTSDGLEEKILFYRFERELLITEALKKTNAGEFD